MIDNIVDALISKQAKVVNRKLIINHESFKAGEPDEAVSKTLGEKFLFDYIKKYPNLEERKRAWESILSKVKEKSNKEKFKQAISNSLPEINLPDHFIPLVDVTNGNKVLVNDEEAKLSEVSFDVWFETLDKDGKAMAKQQIRPAKIVYDPYDLSTLVIEKMETFEVVKVNTYNAPPWRKTERIYTECPEEINTILKHLFTSTKSFEYILDWLYLSLVARNESYLVLNGAKGIGKGIFCSLCRALVGGVNYIEAPESFLDSHFNSTLDKKRIITIDECKVDKPKHTKLKRYINRYQNIEKKGVDANNLVETFNSYIISNNDESDMYLEYDDRRFSVVDLSEKQLIETIEEEKITNLVKELENEKSQIVREFGYFIYNRGAVNSTPFTTFRGVKYYRLVYNSLKVWQKLIIDEIIETQEEFLDLARLRRKVKVHDGRFGFPTNKSKIEDFLNNYLHEGTKKVGELINEGGEWVIKVHTDMLDGIGNIL